jgi:CBS domain-containing protein
MSRVRDIVQNRELFFVEETQTVSDAATRMAHLQVGAIVVLSQGELRGVFSERDIMKRVVLDRLDPASTAVSRVMSTDVVTIDECATVEDAMEAMQSHNCRHLPVTRGGQLVAFLSMRDLMNFELDSKTEELHHMRAYIASHGA